MEPNPDETEIRVPVRPRSALVRGPGRDRQAGWLRRRSRAMHSGRPGPAGPAVGADRDRRTPGGPVGARGLPRRPGGARHRVDDRGRPAGEASKSLACASRLYDELVARKADRHTADRRPRGRRGRRPRGFRRGHLRAGLPLLMVPTTLLAQVDSSVGGKVGINHPGAKNIIGAFHQPVGVWIDTETLATLPDRELRCGLAEVVKYGVILDARVLRRAGRTGRRDPRDGRPGALRRIVARSCRLKADVVARDEREETGLRAVLNFGHTIGHAIESVAGYDGPSSTARPSPSAWSPRAGWPNGWAGSAPRSWRDWWPCSSGSACRRPRRASTRTGCSRPWAGTRRTAAAGSASSLPRAIGHVELTDAADEADVRARPRRSER